MPYTQTVLPALTFDRPVPELTEPEDAQTLAAIEEGIANSTPVRAFLSKKFAKNSRRIEQYG
jgi:hypothetical protein